jgi:hypothetical protein
VATTTSIETSAEAKVTDCTFDEPVQPPDFWTVEVDGRELNVFTEYQEGGPTFVVTLAPRFDRFTVNGPRRIRGPLQPQLMIRDQPCLLRRRLGCG